MTWTDTAQNLGRVQEITVDLDAGKVNLAPAGVEEAPAEGVEEAPISVEHSSLGTTEDPAASMQEAQLVGHLRRI